MASSRVADTAHVAPTVCGARPSSGRRLDTVTTCEPSSRFTRLAAWLGAPLARRTFRTGGIATSCPPTNGDHNRPDNREHDEKREKEKGGGGGEEGGNSEADGRKETKRARGGNERAICVLARRPPTLTMGPLLPLLYCKTCWKTGWKLSVAPCCAMASLTHRWHSCWKDFQCEPARSSQMAKWSAVFPLSAACSARTHPLLVSLRLSPRSAPDSGVISVDWRRWLMSRCDSLFHLFPRKPEAKARVELASTASRIDRIRFPHWPCTSEPNGRKTKRGCGGRRTRWPNANETDTCCRRRAPLTSHYRPIKKRSGNRTRDW